MGLHLETIDIEIKFKTTSTISVGMKILRYVNEHSGINSLRMRPISPSISFSGELKLIITISESADDSLKKIKFQTILMFKN